MADALRVAEAGAWTVTDDPGTFKSSPVPRTGEAGDCGVAVISRAPGARVLSAGSASEGSDGDSVSADEAGPAVAWPEASVVPEGVVWYEGLSKDEAPGASWFPAASTERAPAFFPDASNSSPRTEKTLSEVFGKTGRARSALLLSRRADAPGAKGDWPESLGAEGTGRTEAETTVKAANQERPCSDTAGAGLAHSPLDLPFPQEPGEMQTLATLGPQTTSYPRQMTSSRRLMLAYQTAASREGLYEVKGLP